MIHRAIATAIALLMLGWIVGDAHGVIAYGLPTASENGGVMLPGTDCGIELWTAGKDLVFAAPFVPEFAPFCG